MAITKHEVKCFGWNTNGQLGLGHTDDIGDEAYEMGDYLESIDFGDAFYPIYIKCDVHPWMKSYISVFDHPYFSVIGIRASILDREVPSWDQPIIKWHNSGVIGFIMKRINYLTMQFF